MQLEKKFSYQEFHNIHEVSEWGLLATAIIACISQSFGHEMPPDEVESALKGTYAIISQNEVGKVVGYANLNRKVAESFAHGVLEGYDPQTKRISFGAGVVDKAYQGNGVYRELNRRRVEFVVAEQAPLLTTTTQNPRVEHGITKALEDAVAGDQIVSFSLQRFFLPAFYGRRLTSYDIDTTGTPFEQLNMDAGDGFALVFKLTYPAVGSNS